MRAPPTQPLCDLVRREGRCQQADVGPAGKQRILDSPIVGPEHPVRAALHHGVTELFKALGGVRGGGRAKRRAETLFGPFVQIEPSHQSVIMPYPWFSNATPVTVH